MELGFEKNGRVADGRTVSAGDMEGHRIGWPTVATTRHSCSAGGWASTRTRLASNSTSPALYDKDHASLAQR